MLPVVLRLNDLKISESYKKCEEKYFVSFETYKVTDELTMRGGLLCLLLFSLLSPHKLHPTEYFNEFTVKKFHLLILLHILQDTLF